MPAWRVYAAALPALRTLRREVAATGRLAGTDTVHGLAADLVQAALEDDESLLALLALELDEAYAPRHALDVAVLALVTARALGQGRGELTEIAVAALLHDLGRELGPGDDLPAVARDDGEDSVGQRYRRQGARLLATTPGVGELPVIVAFEHGRPAAGPDATCHPVSRLISLAATYHALRTDRGYRRGLPPDEALDVLLRELRSGPDALLVDAFKRVIGHYPPGTCVRLDDGRTAVVTGRSDEPDRPRLIAVLAADGSLLEPRVVDPRRTAEDVHVTSVVDAEAAGIDPFDHL